MWFDRFMDVLFRVAMFGTLLVLVYVLFVLTPTIMYTKAQCLRQGYPDAQVTVGLERYCTTLDGAVTVKVDEQ